MNCVEIVNLAPLYLSGELDDVEKAAFDAHLRVCSGCAREIEQQREVDARVRGVLLAEAGDPGAVVSAVRNRIAAAESRRRMITLGAIAASILIVAGLLYSLTARRPPALMVAAIRDHQREVVDKQVKKWRSAAPEIDALAVRQGIPANAIAKLSAAGYRLDRARLCRLEGSIYMHLVYSDGTHEVSVFLRPRRGSAEAEQSQDVGSQHVVAVQTGRMTAVCVGEEPVAANRLAGSAAAL